MLLIFRVPEPRKIRRLRERGDPYEMYEIPALAFAMKKERRVLLFSCWRVGVRPHAHRRCPQMTPMNRLNASGGHACYPRFLMTADPWSFVTYNARMVGNSVYHYVRAGRPYCMVHGGNVVAGRHVKTPNVNGVGGGKIYSDSPGLLGSLFGGTLAGGFGRRKLAISAKWNLLASRHFLIAAVRIH